MQPQPSIARHQLFAHTVRWLCLGVFVLGASVLYTTPSQSAGQKGKVVITGVYFDGFMKGNPEPEEAIRISNLSNRTVDISGWIISNRFYAPRKTLNDDDDALTPSHRRSTRRRYRRRRYSGSRRGRFGRKKKQDVILPPGTKLPPKASIWIAHQAEAFKKYFGKYPAFEVKDTASSVEKARAPKGWPNFVASYGIVSLHDEHGDTTDVVCYVRDTRKDNVNKEKVPAGQWSGPSVILKGANQYAWRGQVLARDRDGKGSFKRDTNTARDWDSSFGVAKLGVDPVHRVELPGQSFFQLKNHRNVYAEVIATSAPENNFKGLLSGFRRAKKELLVNIYQFTNAAISDELIKARRRGVKVTVLMEGSPVGGVKKKSRYIGKLLTDAGAKVLWMRGRRSKKRPRRYRFNHAKYVIVDRKWVIIGSENYGTTGHPLTPQFGNRGWEVHVKHPKIVKTMLKVFQDDTDTSRFMDLLPYMSHVHRWGLPPRTFRYKAKVKKGYYTYRKKPLRVRGRMDLQLVLSPDNSLHEKSSLIGTILSCKREVLALQNSIPTYWGKKHFRSFWKTPDLPLMALIKAARKGCRVRVLLDSTWYHIQASEKRDNDSTVLALNNLAKREGLDLQAKLINLDSVGVSKIHAKGIIVDREKVFIGSINWTENSFKGNREVGIIIKHPKIATYYTDLFMHDWVRSRIYQMVLMKRRTRVYKEPNKRSRVLQRFSYGDMVDVLAENGDFYQVRVKDRTIGYLPKGPHTKLFNEFETRWQIGAKGVVFGKIKTIREKKKLAIMYMSPSFQRGLNIIVWGSTRERIERKIGTLKGLIGKHIQIQGKISSYRGTPQIVLRDPKQLTILR